MGRAVKPSGKRQSAPSMALQVEEQRRKALREGLIPDDMGLLPGTFIMPRGKNRPSWLRDFKGRWRMEKARWWQRAQEVFSAFMYRYVMVRPSPRLHLRSITGIAKDLHRDMYTNFASGNLAPIESRLCEGIFGSLKRRISQRPLNTGLKWTLHKHLSKPRLASYRPGIQPGQKGGSRTEVNGVVQAVVRIHSLQSLQHTKRVSLKGANGKTLVREIVVDAHGRELQPVAEGAVPKDAKEAVEYFVIQQNVRKSKAGPWKIWGTAEEMTLEQIRKQDKKSEAMSLAKNANV
ncbi:hypothetical protein LTR08_007694 [Meristemomyces frigidus]|nr:hypothetical protein LTR08_007694 [Meristemomyces frigidus]